MTESAPEFPAAALSQNDFRRFCDLAYKTCGINLQQGKEQLVSARLTKVMRACGITSFDAYYRFVTADPSGKALEGLIDTLTTNHTSFFREPAHFDYLKGNIVPQLRQRGQISIWSAACSTGEEPYSIFFSLLDQMGESAINLVRILATDVSTRVLGRAQRGLFEHERVAMLGTDYLRRHFLRGAGEWSNWFMVKRPIRARTEFKRFNLVEGFYQPGRFPVIFCRNVMIYFDSKTQTKVVKSLSDCLEPGGYLFIGHSESLGTIEHDLEFVAPAIYRRKGALENTGR